MSTLYDTEPQPTASVVLHTTGGEIAVELFAKQTPLTCRNFLQHCLDGYYDDTVFHRLVPGFVLQGGDPSGTGSGGESIYDGGALAGDLDPWPMDERRGANAGPHGMHFKDELHSRLKFNRRGLLGMANEGRPDTNGSQFFFTLDKADELTGKNTMFGRVAGPTIYNLTKIGQGEVQEGTERPLYLTKITRVEIVTNPFADMRPAPRDARRSVVEPLSRGNGGGEDAKKKAGKRKKAVNKNLLSFGDDVDDDLEMDAKKSKKARVVDRAVPASVASPAATTVLPSRDKPSPVPVHAAVAPHAASTSRSSAPASAATLDMGSASASASASASDRDDTPPPTRRPPGMSALEKTNAEIAALKASMRRTVAAEPAPAMPDKSSALDRLVPAAARRGKKFSRKNGLGSHDQKTLRMLDAFTSSLGQRDGNGHASTASAAATARAGDDDTGDAGEDEGSGEVCDLHFIANCQSCRPWDKTKEGDGSGGGGGDSDGEDWMSHTLNCEADKLGKDLSYRKKAEEELIVIDPRERAQTIKERRGGGSGHDGERDGGRSSARHRDQARHARMSQAAALSGRGAR